MTPSLLLPALPFRTDEVTQGYFCRLGQFHAGVDVGRFCRYSGVLPGDFRNGTDDFLNVVKAMSGVEIDILASNTLRRLSDEVFSLRGEALALPVVRRMTVRFCPDCLVADVACDPAIGRGALRLRWPWLLRPVVSCPIHAKELIEVSAQDGVRAFDLPTLLARNEAELKDAGPDEHCLPGALQTYVTDRLEEKARHFEWLDGQTIAQAVKACEMLGSLLAEGPDAQINRYTELDWARVGDIGFGVCAQGAESVAEALSTVRRTSGRRSGRTGPQAVFGKLYRWLEYADKAVEAGPIRGIVREAILTSFVIEPGEVLFGEIVDRLRVHSVNSLKAKTGLNPKRLYRLMLKAGMIPEDTNQEALNQWVFPAAEGDQLIARIQNSIPQNQLKNYLGCSKTQAEQLVAGVLVTSVVPVAEGRIGMSVGAYNRDELSHFLARACTGVSVASEEAEGFLDLTRVCKGRSSTIEVIRWQIDGKLRNTRLIGGRVRLDGLRFSLAEVRALVLARSRTDLHRLTAAARLLRVDVDVVKRLVSGEGSWPALSLARREECRGLHGQAYVSTAEIERFTAQYLPLAWAADLLGQHPVTASRTLAPDVRPVCDPRELGTWLYHRQDVEAFIARAGDERVHDQGRDRAEGSPKEAEDAGKRPELADLVKSMLPSGETDATRHLEAGSTVE